MRSKRKAPEVGRVFSIPLLDGGFAFGYATAVFDEWRFCDILDHVATSTAPPTDLLKKPIVLEDLVAGTVFYLPRFPQCENAGSRWEPTELMVPWPVRPKNRYVRMERTRVDILREEPPMKLSADEAEQYPHLACRFAPYQAAVVEIAVKRLSIKYRELIENWVAGKLKTRPQPPVRRPRKGAKSEYHFQISLGHSGFPSDAELKLRDTVEALISERGVGTVTGSGGGMGLMDLVIRTQGADPLQRLHEIAKEACVPPGRLTIEPR